MTPRAPAWAVAGGMAEPDEGELFDAYWLRVGFTGAEIEEACDGLDDRKLEVANARLASRVKERMPEAFDAYVRSRCLLWGVNPADRMSGWGQVIRLPAL